jgi:transcriptional regulator with XRE-family HTH domain
MGKKLREKRIGAAISGYAVCLKAGIGRSRLSEIERGHIQPSEDEVARLQAAIDQLIQARHKVEAVAAEVGWPLP